MGDDDRFAIRQRDDPTPEMPTGARPPSSPRFKRLAGRPISWPLWRLIVIGLATFFVGVCTGAAEPPEKNITASRAEDVLPRASTTIRERTATTEKVTTTTAATTVLSTTTTTTAAPAPPPTQAVRQAPPPSSNCDPAYPDFCIPPPPPDLDCDDVEPLRLPTNRGEVVRHFLVVAVQGPAPGGRMVLSSSIVGSAPSSTSRCAIFKSPRHAAS
jgi:hypothetical protein